MNGQLMNVEAWRSIVDGGLPPPSASRRAYSDGLRNWRSAFADDARLKRVHTDANESAIFAASLEYWLSETIDMQYPQLLADSLIPMKTSIPPGASDVVTYGYDQTGEARVLANYGEDIPRVDLHAQRMTTPMISLAAAFAVTLQQVREAAMAGGGSGQQAVPLENLGLAAVRRVLMTRADQILSIGDATIGAQGILNVTGVVPGAFTTGGWNAVGAATAAQVDADVSLARSTLFAATGNVFEPDTLLLPTTAYAYIQTLPMFVAGGPTVLEWLQQKHGLNVVKWWRCDGSGAAGVDRAMLFSNTREVIEGYRSIDVELLAPEYRSTYWLTVGHCRTAGCNSAKITAIGYYDNV